MTVIHRGGPEYLNLLVMLFAWDTIKFAVVGVVTPFRWLGTLARGCGGTSQDTN